MVFSKKGGIADRMNRSLIKNRNAKQACAMKCRLRALESQIWRWILKSGLPLRVDQ
jgi:hypothetical protein